MMMLMMIMLTSDKRCNEQSAKRNHSILLLRSALHFAYVPGVTRMSVQHHVGPIRANTTRKNGSSISIFMVILMVLLTFLSAECKELDELCCVLFQRERREKEDEKDFPGTHVSFESWLPTKRLCGYVAIWQHGYRQVFFECYKCYTWISVVCQPLRWPEVRETARAIAFLARRL